MLKTFYNIDLDFVAITHRQSPLSLEFPWVGYRHTSGSVATTTADHSRYGTEECPGLSPPASGDYGTKLAHTYHTHGYVYREWFLWGCQG